MVYAFLIVMKSGKAIDADEDTDRIMDNSNFLKEENKMERREKLLFWCVLLLNAIIFFAGLGSFQISQAYMDSVSNGEYSFLSDEEELFPEELTYYYRTMFDEVLYAGSAYEFLQGEVMYEETHPPMGKILIALGVSVFGLSPFGWRVVSALFGLGMLPFVYWFLHKLFRDRRAALLGMTLLSLDFMHYTLSRIGTLDSIVAFFILATFAMLWEVFERIGKDIQAKPAKPAWSLLAFMMFHALIIGMGVSCKWTGFYAMAGAAVCFLVFWVKNMRKAAKNGNVRSYLVKLLVEAVLIYSLIPLAVYVISFLPQTIAQGEYNVWKVMWDSSLQMLEYHDSIVFEHSYSSEWYTWIWNKRPLLDAANILQNGKVSLVVTMGNPILWWCGIVSVFHMAYRFLVKKDSKAGYLLAAYLFMLVPWMFVKRTVFIYQYYASSIFMICALSYSLSILGQKQKKAVPIFIEVTLCVFLMFFPILSGLPINGSYVQKFLQWLPDWNFIL